MRTQVWKLCYRAFKDVDSSYFSLMLILSFLMFLGCKLLYKHDLAKRWGNHCKMCSYCLQTSPKLVQNNLGGKVEEFCCEECMSKYTVLFYQVNIIHNPGFFKLGCTLFPSLILSCSIKGNLMILNFQILNVLCSPLVLIHDLRKF